MPLSSFLKKPTKAPIIQVVRDGLPIRPSQGLDSTPVMKTLRGGSGPGAHDEPSKTESESQREMRRSQKSGLAAEPDFRGEATSETTKLADSIDVAGEDALTKMFWDLSIDIEAWSKKFITSSQRPQGPKSSLVQDREKATKFMEKVIVAEDNRAHKLANLDQEAVRVLYQAVLWHELDRQVFEKYVWAGGECSQDKVSGGKCEPLKILTQSDGYLRNAYKVKLSSRPGLAPLNRYLEWRMHTTLAILPLVHTECAAKHVDSIVQNLVNIFSDSGLDFGLRPGVPWLENPALGANEPREKPTLVDIVKSAVKLDQQWNLQRRSFHLLTCERHLRARFKKRHNAYDAPHMRRHEKSPSYIEYDASQRQTIMLVIRPAVFKASHSDINKSRFWEGAAQALVEIGVTTTAPLDYGGGAGDFD